jgi:hypothetical protein
MAISNVIFLAGLILSTTGACRVFAGSETGTTPDPVTQSTLASLTALVARNHFELSTAPTSAADKFCFETSVVLNAGVCKPFRILVIRDKSLVVILIRTIAGQCYTYCANGILMSIDHDHPGYLKCAAGNPYFVERINDSGEFENIWGFGHNTPRSNIMLSLNEIFQTMMSHVTTARYNEVSKRFDVHTKRSSASIGLFADSVKWVIKSFTTRNDDSTCEMSFISCGTIPQAYKNLLDPIAVKKRAEEMNLQLINCPSGMDINDFLGDAFFVPLDLGNNATESAAIDKWTDILMPHDATTQAIQGQ